MQFVIQEVARRKGLSEDLVEKAIRSAEMDVRDFLSEKRGYSLLWPKLGTFTFRVSFIQKYIQMQRYNLAYWKYRLSVGEMKANSRTIIASQENIQKHTFRIHHSLLIKQEYLNEHSKYNRNKSAYLDRTCDTDISRLEELLDVAQIVAQFEEKYRGQENHLPEVPGKGLLSSAMGDDQGGEV